MSTQPPDVTGIVLAAGAGRRMGGPKALVGPLATEGVPLGIVCERLHDAGIARIIAVIGAQADAVRAALRIPHGSAISTQAGLEIVRSADALGLAPSLNPTSTASCDLTVVEASDWASGMGASLRAGLAAASRLETDVALVTLVDLPDVGPDVYARVARSASGPATLARATYLGRPGHPVLIGRDHFGAVADVARGDRGARDLFRSVPHDRVECGDLATGVDADRPD